MERRKIQLIAGTTYSVSLPKKWVKKNSLKQGNEISIIEKSDSNLVISPRSFKEKKLNEISLNVDDYMGGEGNIQNLSPILFACYYIGIEKITLFSKEILSKNIKTKIRKTLLNMSGTEISYEDEQKITIRVLLDKSKIEFSQIIYRIGILIEYSILNLTNQLNINEIRLNENEIDRLYHLAAKMISLSLIDSNILDSSKIKNNSLILSYFLMSKKLENLSDTIYYFSEYINKNKTKTDNKKIFDFVRNEINRGVKYIVWDHLFIFERIGGEKLDNINELISKIKDKSMQRYFEDIIRYLKDIEDEIVNISFYSQLIRKGFL